MVSVFAPVNIAWIKYMGKEDGRPTNASLSMTLDQIGSWTEMWVTSREKKSVGPEWTWNSMGYVPPEEGIQKAEQFLSRPEFAELLKQFGIEAKIPAFQVEITTRNNVPAATGIATSASGFAALTLAWLGILAGDQSRKWKELFASNVEVKQAVAKLSGLGSGSACRSFMGPFVEWDPKQGVSAVQSEMVRFVDLIILLESEPKKVSSSEAHLRVKTSPLFAGRVKRANERLTLVKRDLKNGSIAGLAHTVLEEALDMHELFHTSKPPFSYWSEESKRWIDLIRYRDKSLPDNQAILTLDAGANVHLFVERAELARWEGFLTDQKVSFLKAGAGEGARYVD